eukprot:Tamp_15730.p1 GENE.Tamp_15730~~Tamp_15730.p1  ORF type:complete len:411 (+),score=61.89 Tamp_15730:235-1467(+)
MRAPAGGLVLLLLLAGLGFAASLCVPTAGPAASLARCVPSSPGALAPRRMRGGGAPAATAAAGGEAAAREGAMEVARRALLEAAAAARFVASSYSAKFEEGTVGKSDASPVTVADFAVQAIVCARLLQAFPDDPIIAEEAADELRANRELCERVLEAVRVAEPSATAEDICTWIDRGTERNYSERFWTLDPIDGTKGFLRREQYALCLALIENGIPSAGVLACPNLEIPAGEEGGGRRGVLFCASLNGGAWQHAMPEDGGGAAGEVPRKRLALKEIAKTAGELRFCESVEAAHSNHELSGRIASSLEISRPPLRMDSQVKYGIMARGDADVYLRLPHAQSGISFGKTYQENIWDHAAGHLVLTEAGGAVTDMNGLPLDFRHGSKLIKNKGVVASGGPALHERVLAAIAAS